jgi:hypothetical protein
MTDAEYKKDGCYTHKEIAFITICHILTCLVTVGKQYIKERGVNQNRT